MLVKTPHSGSVLVLCGRWEEVVQDIRRNLWPHAEVVLIVFCNATLPTQKYLFRIMTFPPHKIIKNNEISPSGSSSGTWSWRLTSCSRRTWCGVKFKLNSMWIFTPFFREFAERRASIQANRREIRREGGVYRRGGRKGMDVRTSGTTQFPYYYFRKKKLSNIWIFSSRSAATGWPTTSWGRDSPRATRLPCWWRTGQNT